MNAGLLGEHLASPRTAQKTNQSTALDPKTAKGGDSANKDGFASFVSKESEPAAADAPSAENAVATPQAPPPKDQTSTISLDQAVLSPQEIEVSTPQPESPRAPLDQIATQPQLSVQATDADPAATAAAVTSQAPTGEILVQDPRARVQTESRDATRASRGETIKIVETGGLVAADPTVENEIAIDGEAELDQRLRVMSGSADAESDVPRPSTTIGSAERATLDAHARLTPNSEGSSFDRLLTGGLSREAVNITPDQVLNTAPVTTTTSAPSSVSVNGLTPTGPSIPLATPNELTGIIVNAINNGLDPQEQLVVQLDPPELGRVMIDFKFDAQGLQQVVVTTENPEALKRLRELHFELTQALKEHGLSEQNMSFRQDAEGQSRDAWGDDNSAPQNAQYFAVEERRTSPSTLPTGPRSSAQDRLDLLL